MDVALIEIPKAILQELHDKKLLAKEAYVLKEVYTFGAKDQPEYVKKLAELKIIEADIRSLYTKKNTILKTLENDTQ